MSKPYEQGRIFVGRLPKGADLLHAITKVANDEGIKAGTIVVHGVVARVALSIFNAATRMGSMIEREEGMEIASMSGTISQFKGRSMARLEGVFAASDGTMIGGAIALGTVVYACEVVITELVGATLSRDFDPETGLPLWKGSLLLPEN